MTANRIIAHVFLQPSLQQVDEAVMEKLVADHPYFSAARLLLAQKVYQQTGDLHSNAVKKALLYTHQHHYAYQLITEMPVLPENFQPPVAPDNGKSIAAELEEEQVLPMAEDRLEPVIPEDSLPIAATTQDAPIGAALEEEQVLPVVEDQLAPVIPEDSLPIAATTQDAPIGAALEEEQVLPVVEDQLAPVIPEDSLPDTFPVILSVQEDRLAPVIPEDELPESATADSFSHLTTSEAPLPAAEAETPVTSPVAAHDNIAIHVTAPGDAAASGPIKIFPLNLSIAAEETELTFQPLYSDDYFAYNRLKNPDEADQLNEQGAAEMKSFTSWLRQIKDNFAGKSTKDWYHQQLHRLYEEDNEPEVSETVEKMAIASITFNNDIVSETLAEIWVHQQQYGNAIKIYQKLSLLNPDKNAYFAQKILELKTLKDKNK
ncbi:hypothetical protein ACDQ55_11805 [Chitinophaga sp. 30R24]|uniref:hypothetical protein n=1 Tax=Chitinophaga sp. 30R24 TaxID=3248838 RepID=UPI003B91280C